METERPRPRAGPPQHRAAPPRGGGKFGANPGGLCPALGSVPGSAAGRRTREVSPAPRSGLKTRKPGAKCLFSLTTPPVVSLFLLQLSQLIASLLQLPWHTAPAAGTKAPAGARPNPGWNGQVTSFWQLSYHFWKALLLNKALFKRAVSEQIVCEVHLSSVPHSKSHSLFP